MFWIRRPPVQRSSESFAALATALAKAQAHLVNPEKSLTATIRPGRPGETARSFRYAPLSSGLEIVRKTLSEHEIAVIQTTAVDQASRMLSLTTLLAHSSGEWIASYWPVCSVAEVVNPHRMGAALTYARRYALFTLVGIAGEDDLDAPDICMPAPATGSSTVGLQFPSQPQGNGKVRGAAKTPSPMVLPVDESAALRDRLLSEVAGLASQDSATSWAREALPTKNSLTATDAKTLEDAFEQKLAGFLPGESAGAVASSNGSSVSAAGSPEAGPGNSTDPHQPTGIDKSVLAISVSRRYRNKEHLRFVIRQPCLLCGRKPSDPHHLRFVQPRALGRKSSDEFAVLLCRIHHRAVHRAGDERAWWKATGIDPLKVARKLWKDTLVSKPLGPVGVAVYEPHNTPKPHAVDREAP
jgi:ERF superfamily